MNKSYPLKHWLTTLLIGPFLPVIYHALRFSPKDASGWFETYPLFLIFGLAFSLPVFLIYFLVFNFLIKSMTSSLLIKTILNTIAVAGVFITCNFIGGSLGLTWCIAYSVAIIISSFFNDITNTNEQFKSISIRGRLAYGMVCLERLIQHLNINDHLLTDFVFKEIWSFTSSTDLSKWEAKVNEIDPDCILDERANPEDFSIGTKRFHELKTLYQKLPSSVVSTISNVISIGTSNLYGGTEDHSPSTLKALDEVIKEMHRQKVKLPETFKFKRSGFSEFHGWGDGRPRDFFK